MCIQVRVGSDQHAASTQSVHQSGDSLARTATTDQH